jgi:peptidoglycan/xylan/chitin deacetylase (PgdA/CDA1 family)
VGLTKKIIRRAVLPAALILRLDKLLLRRSAKKCCIVNFHGVRSGNPPLINNRHLPLKTFDKMLWYLCRNFDIVPLSQIFDMHREKKRPSRQSIALTFDDGYLNNFEVALPVLRKYDAPATFYIITGALERKDFVSWPDIVDILKRYHKKDILLNNIRFSYPEFIDAETGTDLMAYLKKQGIKAAKIANQILEGYDYLDLAGRDIPELIRTISADTISKYKSEKLIEYGSHTHTHPCMEYVEEHEAAKELSLSKKTLEKLVGKPVTSVAFPDGSYSQETLRICLDHGYTDLAAVKYKYGEANSHPNLLSRFTVSNSTTFESNVIRLAREFEKFGF